VIPMPTDLKFWTHSSRVVVRFRRGDASFDRLCAELLNTPGIYSLEIAGCVLRVGLAGQRTARKETSGLGQRLKHHLEAGCGEAAYRKAEFNDHFEFHNVLLGRQMTIRWMRCSPEELRDAERAAIQSAPGGVLWEQLRLERTAVKHDPTRHGELSIKVKEALDDGITRGTDPKSGKGRATRPAS
jgi:hypothetical protein